MEDIWAQAVVVLYHQLLVLSAGFDPGSEDGRMLVAFLGSPEVESETVEDVWRLASQLIVAPDFVPASITD